MRLFGHHFDRLIIKIFLSDAALLAVAFYGAYFARWADTNSPAQTVIVYAPNAALFIGFTLLSMIMLGCYERAALVRRRVCAIRLVASLAISIAAMALAFYAIPDLIIWRSGLIIAVPVAFILIMVSRIVLTYRGISGRFAKRILLLSDHGRPAMLDEVLQQDGVPTVRIAAFLELTDQRRQANDHAWLFERAQALGIDEIVVNIDERRDRLPFEALRTCRLRGLEILDFAAFAERETGRVDLDHFNSDWLIFSRGFRNTAVDRISKRIFDIVISLALLIFTLPLIVVSSLIVKFQDGGPVIFSQPRVGLHGQVFNLLKLRSMRPDAEKNGPQYAKANDDRTTWYGRIMRRSRIDELPQLLNILKGEMSFVGPRPERPVFVDALAQKIPFFRERHMVKPGLSGWAQINYPYADDDESTRRKLEYDIFYVKNANIFLDIVVLAQTLRVVVWGSGAR